MIVIYLINIFISGEKECRSDTYNLFYTAAHNDEIDKVRMYVEENGCCPNVRDRSNGGSTALWVARGRGNVDVVAYLESVLCGKNVVVGYNIYGFNIR